jgi:thiol-disulfide isomerase/thioredoxin
MKKILWILSLFFITSCQIDIKNKKAGFEIIGQIKNAPDSTLVILSNEYISDTTLLINGRFNFSGSVDQPRKVLLKIKNVSDGKTFWLENSKITIKGDYNDFKYAHVAGGENQKILNLLWNKQEPTLRLMDYYVLQIYNDSIKKHIRDSLSEAYKFASNKLEDINKKFINEHPNTLESVIWLNIKRTQWNKDSVTSMFSKMNEKIKNTESGVTIAEYLKLSTKPKIGDRYIDFTLRKLDDENVKISKLMGSYTLIDFWASWCIPCREENPNLIELHRKYNDKGFNIIGVSMDRDKSKWIKAIKDDELPWDQLTDEISLDKNNIFMLYDVKSIPDNLLLNEDGIIIDRNLRGTELNDQLEVLFGF